MSKNSMTGNNVLTGGRKVDTLVGDLGNDKLRGKEGNDILWGDKTDGTGGGSDTFIFEKSFAYNGMDTIMDYHWTEDGTDNKGQDVLDLTSALKAFKEALERGEKVELGDYVKLEAGTGGMNLMVDQDGVGEKAAEQWAFLNGLTAADAVRVRAFTVSASGSGSAPDIGDGYFTLGGAKELTSGHLFVLAQGGQDVRAGGTDDARDSYWLDDGDGIFDPTKDTNVTDATNKAVGIDYTKGEWTVEFLGVPGADLIDLTGFGADDHIIVNAKAMNNYLNMWGSADTNGGKTSAFSRWGYQSETQDRTSLVTWAGGFLKSGLNKLMDTGVFNFFDKVTYGGGLKASATAYYDASSTPTFTNALAGQYVPRPTELSVSGYKVPLVHLHTTLTFRAAGTKLRASLQAHASYSVRKYSAPTFRFGYEAWSGFSLKLASGLDSTALPSLLVVWPTAPV